MAGDTKAESARSQELIGALRKVWKNFNCVACGSKEWEVGGDYFVPVWKGREVNLGRGAPVVGVACKTCGHLMFFSAKVLGVFEEPKP